PYSVYSLKAPCERNSGMPAAPTYGAGRVRGPFRSPQDPPLLKKEPADEEAEAEPRRPGSGHVRAGARRRPDRDRGRPRNHQQRSPLPLPLPVLRRDLRRRPLPLLSDGDRDHTRAAPGARPCSGGRAHPGGGYEQAERENSPLRLFVPRRIADEAA